MKTRDFLWGLLACAAFSACSSDEVVKNDNLEKSKSYMRVSFNIADDAASRNARGVTDGGFAEGTETNIITGNTIFLFYTASGDYVTSGTLVDTPTLEGNETVMGGDHSDNVNSKYDTDAVVVLDCTEVLKNNITQMLTVANIRETASLQNKVLADALDEIALVSYNSPSGIIIDGETGFLMSTSVFVEGDEIKNVTPIDPEDNFAESEEEAKSNEKAVEVYLERASAKVEVAKADDFTSSVTEKVDGTEEVLEITIAGWTLNGTVKDTYIVKQMEDDWIANDPFDKWNYALNHRSYWAKSTNWSNTSGKPDEDYVLDYKSWDEVGTSLGIPEYCFENTISGTPSVTDHNITTVLVKAYFGDGYTDYYEFAGDFYTTAEYKKLILAQLASAGYKKSPDGTTFVALESGDVMFDTNGLSGVKVAMLPSNTYAKDESFVETTDVNTYVNALPLITTVKGYKNGACRYQIPIEHLHSIDPENPKYGVVRNHWYKLTINKITKIGTAVYDPDVPNTDLDEEELTYYMAVKLHVLSWHMVNQNVTL